MTKPKKILYLHFGAHGMDTYLHGIAQAMQHLEGIECHLAANWYYRRIQTDGNVKLKRVFFPVTEMSEDNRFMNLPGFSLVRLPLRYLELWIGYLVTLLYIVVARIDIVNLSLTGIRLPALLFAGAVKALRRKLVVTAHDVLPFGTRDSIALRRQIFEWADRVVVHYEHVQALLIEHYGVPCARIYIHPFPGSDVDAILNQAQVAACTTGYRAAFKDFSRVFLFIGVLRPEKGLAHLLNAWRQSDFRDNTTLLVVAGRPVPGVDVRSMVKGLPTVKVMDRYLKSAEFWALLTACDVVVLPYAAKYYAHSGVIYTTFLAAKCVVASDIPLFQCLVGDRNGYLFQAGDDTDLARVLAWVAKESVETLCQKGEVSRDWLLAEREKLPAYLAELYSQM